MLTVISESNSTEPLNEFMKECTINALQPPELTHIIHKGASQLDSMHSTEFPMNDVFECILPTDVHSMRSENLFVIFGMLLLLFNGIFRLWSVENQDCISIFHQFSQRWCPHLHKMIQNSLKFGQTMQFPMGYCNVELHRSYRNGSSNPTPAKHTMISAVPAIHFIFF